LTYGFLSDLDNFRALIVDLSVGGGEEREKEERENEHEHPVQGGRVGQPVHHPPNISSKYFQLYTNHSVFQIA
jgi:hypothetical protein